jgi:hypothetical protein
MAYVHIEMCLVPHVIVEILDMAYIPIKTCLTHNIFNVYFETYINFHCAFHIMENLFHYNPMRLLMNNHKLVYNPHYLSNIKFFTYLCIHQFST